MSNRTTGGRPGAGTDIQPNVSCYLNRSTGWWYCNVYWPDTQERKRYSLRTRVEAEARDLFPAFVKKVVPDLVRIHAESAPEASERAASRRGQGPRLADLLTWYLDTHLPQHARPSTISKYRQTLTDLVFYLKSRHIGRPGQLSMRVLQEWQVWLDSYRRGRQNREEPAQPGPQRTHASKSCRDSLAIVRAFLNACVRAGELDASPIQYWDLPRKAKRKNKALRMPELIECLDTIAERSPSIVNICRFLAYSGWRVSDAMDLRWGEVEMAGPRAIGNQIDRDQIKTQDGLSYPVTPPIRACLETALATVDGRPKAKDYVFLEAHGSPWTYNAVYRRLTRTLAAANFPRTVSPHVFRTTFATLAASSDPPVPPRVLQNLLGHRDLKDTLQYYTEVQLGDLSRWSSHVSMQISGKTTEHPRATGNPPKKPWPGGR